MKRNQSGFTLIEIAIVLVIIGLLLGGVLKGQELINSARVKNLATDFKNIPVYIYGYQDKFRALPGDDAQVVNHVAGTLATTGGTVGNGVIEGDWNSGTDTDESILFWQHVRLAGLATGSTTPAAADYMPVNASGGIIGITSGTNVAANAAMTSGGVALRGSYIICSAGILGKFVKQLDLQMDDGNTAGGSMMAGDPVAVGTAMTAVATAAIDEAASYTVCMGI
ncbi:MAG: prepilin-type N-terminal cleavage/methylation domain-containing protein [Nitrosomonadales bacterium]|nr:prepilin-type N-terminal cleavage/methylation domain-containing protein [Nitrosomonadales bacterium]